MKLVNRIAALSGVFVPVSIITSVAMADLSDRGVAIDSSGKQIVAALNERHDTIVVAGWVGLVAMVLLAVFTAWLTGVLSDSGLAPSWLAYLALIGGGMVMMVLVVDTGMVLVAREASDFGADPAAIKAMYAWSWNSANLYAPGFGVMVLATTLVAHVDARFPRWFVWYGIASMVAILAISLVLGAPGLATMPASMWVVVCSVLMAVRTNLLESDAGAGNPSDAGMK